MDRERTRTPEHEAPEDEGIPDLGRPHPAKRNTGDPQEGLVLPGESARAAEDSGVTAEEQREGAPLEERLSEELPDGEAGGRHDSGRLIEDGSGVTDEEKDLVADEAEDDIDGRTAEEAAVRVEESEPSGVTDGPDTYLPEEDTEAGDRA